MCHPLAGGFWFSKVKHCGNPSICSAADFFKGRRTGAREFLPQILDAMNDDVHAEAPADSETTYFTRIILTLINFIRVK